jgi:hypothetical protein
MKQFTTHIKWPGLKRILQLGGILGMAFACTDEIAWDLKYQEEDLIVVEGKITDEAKQHEVYLSKPLYEMNGKPEPVSGLIVEITDGRNIHPLHEDRSRPGTYLTSAGFAGKVNQGYQLRIHQGDKLITAISYLRAVTPFQNMLIYPVQTNPPLFEVNITDSDEPAIVRLELDWSHVPGYDTLSYDQNHALIYHYTLGTIDVNRMFPPERENVRFPPGTLVFREKESVNVPYEEFLRGMVSETDFRGGVFDVLPGNARTNLTEGAIGYFTAAQVIRDTVVIE